MAQLNRYSFAGYYFNGPNVKVRQVTKGSPPLRGSNFIAPGRTGEIWTPKKHGGRMLTLEILVIDEPRGTARMIFDQIQQLAATRTQSALVNYLDSGPRTAQAEIVNWTAQDIDNVGLVFVGQLDFYLADPWFYGATVTSSVVPGNTITVGEVETNPVLVSPARSSYTITMTNATSGQPILVLNLDSNVTSITDTFATPYSWVRVDQSTNGVDLWIGTGGVGTTGVITVNNGGNYSGGAAFALAGASTAAGALAIDVHGSVQVQNNSPVSFTLTPSAAHELYFVGVKYGTNTGNGSAPVNGPLTWKWPWVTADLTGLTAAQRRYYVSWYTDPPSGVALPYAFAYAPNDGNWVAGAIVKTTGGVAATLNVTNPGNVTAEHAVLTFTGPIINPTIVNATTGTSVTFTAPVAAGTTAVIDCGASSAINNGVNAIGALTHTGATNFLPFGPGVNALTVYSSGCTGATLLTVSFAPGYV